MSMPVAGVRSLLDDGFPGATALIYRGDAYYWCCATCGACGPQTMDINKAAGEAFRHVNTINHERYHDAHED